MKRIVAVFVVLVGIQRVWASQPVLIIALGDSTTAGTPFFQSPLEVPPDGQGDPEGQYSYWMMRRHPDWKVLNEGIAGQISDEVRARFDDAIKAGPRFIILLAGVNDIARGMPLAVPEKNLIWMYRQAKAKSVVPVAATVVPFDRATPEQAEAIRRLNKWIARAAELEHIPIADLNTAVADPANPDRLNGSPDGLHPDIGGYRKMGEVLARTVEPLTRVGRH